MTEAAAKPMHPVAELRRDVRLALPTMALGSEKTQERMMSVLMIAVERDPDLAKADRQSLIAAIRQCANHGLVPDGNEATLQVYNTKVKINGVDQWIKKVQYQPMVRGIINRVQNSGKVRTFWAELVYEGEKFSIDISDGERRPVHVKESEFSRGSDDKVVGAYSVAKFQDGTIDCEPMGRDEIEKVRKVAKTQKVWDGWFGEKAKVAVLRRHSKRLPLSSEDLDMILNRDETDFDRMDVTPPAPAKSGFAAMADAARDAARELPNVSTVPVEDAEVEQEAETVEATAQEAAQKKSETSKGRGKTKAKPDDFDPSSDAYKQGQNAAAEGFITEDQCPVKDDETARRDWLAGYRSVGGDGK